MIMSPYHNILAHVIIHTHPCLTFRWTILLMICQCLQHLVVTLFHCVWLKKHCLYYHLNKYFLLTIHCYTYFPGQSLAMRINKITIPFTLSNLVLNDCCSNLFLTFLSSFVDFVRTTTMLHIVTLTLDFEHFQHRFVINPFKIVSFVIIFRWPPFWNVLVWQFHIKWLLYYKNACYWCIYYLENCWSYRSIHLYDLFSFVKYTYPLSTSAHFKDDT
jgi:hypothetical protein